MIALGIIVELEPIKQFSFTETWPFITTDVATWELLPMLQSCSIIDLVFIIQFLPILTLALIITPCIMIEPSPTVDELDT